MSYAIYIRYRDGKDERRRVSSGWVADTEWGRTITNFLFCDPNTLGNDLTVFETREEAQEYLDRFQGHPWWATRNRWTVTRILEVKPVTKVVQAGWREVAPRPKFRKRST